jgi:hypothetical protein
MKIGWFSVLAFTLLAPSAPGNGTPGDASSARRALGEQLVDSLKDDNIVGYSQCWLSAAVIFTAASNGPGCTERELEWLRKSLPARDLRIARQFEFLRDRLKEVTKDISSLKLESVQISPGEVFEDETQRGSQFTPHIALAVRIDPDTVVEIAVNGAGGGGDSWRLTGPLDLRNVVKVTRRGKSTTVNIMTGKEEVWFSIPPSIIKGALKDKLSPDAAPSKATAPRRAETADEGRWFLGGCLVQSLRDDNIVAYAQCWESAKNLLRRASHNPDRNAGEEALGKLPKELAARDLRLSRQFELLRDRFKEVAQDLSSLKIESVSGGPMELRESPVSGCTITREPPFAVRVDKDTVVEIPVDSAHAEKFGNYWYFTGPPDTFLKVTQHGKSRLVNILTGDPAHVFADKDAERKGLDGKVE